MQTLFPSLLFLITTSCPGFSKVLPQPENKPYRAAVYEHAVVSAPAKLVTRQEAIKNMMKNVRIYEKQTKIAAQKGAQIIVFPEHGLIGLRLDRTTVKPYLEEVPDPRNVQWNPSENPKLYKDTEIQQELSRIARQNRIYIVANVGTKITCSLQKDPSCPCDGQHQYNTNVVYSDEGTLIAVYHKRNLYIDKPFEPAKKPEYVIFDTPFGRFGTVVCFDLLFEEPTYTLITKHKVRNIAYPTAWVKIPPFFRSLMVHSGYARANSINLLASDLHVGSAHGSGLYSPFSEPQEFFYDTTPGVSRLLIKDMDVPNEKTPSTSDRKQAKELKTDKENDLTGSVLGLKFSFKLLPKGEISGSLRTCNKDFCCRLVYEITAPSSETYALGISNGDLHITGNRLYTQTCSLSKCENKVCDSEIRDAKTIFKSFELSGENFQTTEILPSIAAMNASRIVITDDPWTYNQTGHLYMEGPMSLPLHSAVLNGRVYSKDVPDTDKKQNFPTCDQSSNGTPRRIIPEFLSVLLVLISFYLSAN